LSHEKLAAIQRRPRSPISATGIELSADKLADQPGSMRRQPIPDHQQLAWQVAQQVAEEVDHLRRADGGGIEPEVKAPLVCRPANNFTSHNEILES